MNSSIFDQINFGNFIYQGIASIAVILIVIVEVYFIFRGAAILKRKMIRLAKGQKLPDHEIIEERFIFRVISTSIEILKLAAVFFSCYVSLIFIVNLFPGTENIVNTLIGYVTEPAKQIFNSIVGYVPNLISIIIIVFVFRYWLKLMNSIKVSVAKGNLRFENFDPEWANPTAKIATVISYAFLIAMIFPLLPGASRPEFKGIAALLGVLVSFGGGSSISNFIDGIILTYMKPFRVGDVVKINGHIGSITGRTPFAVKILTPKNEEITVPNNRITTSDTTNYSTTGNALGHATISIGYDVPYQKVESLLLSAAEKTLLIDKSLQPFVFQTNLQDFYVVYELNFLTRTAQDRNKALSELHGHILDEFNAAKIEILSPHYQAMREGPETIIPSEKISPKGLSD